MAADNECDCLSAVAANGPILRALELPSVYGITCADDGGVARFYALLEDALSNGLRLVQVRENQ